MTDLGHLIAGVEDAVEHAHATSAADAATLAATVRRVRRRRTGRHVRDAACAVLVVAVAGVAVWGVRDRTAAPADVPSPTSSPGPDAAPSPSASPPVVGTPMDLGEPRQVGTPRDVPAAELLAGAGPGWVLTSTTTIGPDAAVDPDGYPVDADDVRTTVALVAPDGTRTALLDLHEGVLESWVAGQPLAVVSGVGDAPGRQAGFLDLRTGVVTTVLTFPWLGQAMGTAVTGEGVWLEMALPEELATLPDEERARVRPGVAQVPFEPEAEGGTPGTDLPAVPQWSATLALIGPDGLRRDLGSVTPAYRLRALSPDRTWFVGVASDGGLVGVDLRTGASHPVAGSPDDPACRLPGWADDHDVLVACPRPDGSWQLSALDVAANTGARDVAVSDVPVRDAWPLGDGRVGLGRVVLPAPCEIASDPAVLEDGRVRSLTDRWSPYDHGTSLTFTGTAVWTHVNGCYPGSGRADPQRDVRVDVTTGETTTLGWTEPRRDRDPVTTAEGRVTGVRVVPGR